MFDKIRNKHFAHIFSVLGVTAKQLSAAQVSVYVVQYVCTITIGSDGSDSQLSHFSFLPTKLSNWPQKKLFRPAKVQNILQYHKCLTGVKNRTTYLFLSTECPKIYCIIVLHLRYTYADAVQICGKFRNTQ